MIPEGRDWSSGTIIRRSALLALHALALGVMLWSEVGAIAIAAFLLTWGLLNCLALALLRRPIVSAVLALAIVLVFILLSRLKYEIVWMTANFLDLWVVNPDSISFLLSVKPALL